MAVINRLGSFVCAFVFLYHLTYALNEFKEYVAPDSCAGRLSGNRSLYFNTSLLECKPCQQDTSLQISDGYNCVCQKGCKYRVNFGGQNVECEKCPVNQVVSRDGYSCVACPNNAVYDPQTSTCTTCPGSVNLALQVERTVDGTLSNPRSCTTCTGVTFLNSAKDRCVRCTNYLATNPSLTSCVCPDSQLKGGYCFTSASQIVVTTTLQTATGGTLKSLYFEDNLESAYFRCYLPTRVTSACQQLANMCTLSLYSYTGLNQQDTACNMYKFIQSAGLPQWPDFMPWLYYADQGGSRTEADSVLDDLQLTTQFTFDPLSYLDFKLARYSLGGEFLGITDATGGKLQLCSDTTQRLNAAYTFGTYYTQTCSIPALELWDKTKYPLEFYDIYLKFTKETVDQLYAIPLRIFNFRFNGQEINRGSRPRDWQLMRRMFLVDNVASTGTGTAAVPEMVRYAKSIEVIIRLSDTSDASGTIYPPYINIEYDQVTRTSAEDGATISPTFTMTYWMTQIEFRRDFQIATGTLSTLGVLFAGYRTWAWSKRAGKLAIDFATILNFLFFSAGSLANVFFIVSFGIAFYFLVFFKRQGVVHLFHIIGLSEQEWLGLFGSAFALKALQVVHMIVMQCTADIFLIDWERPRGGVVQPSKGEKEEGTNKKNGSTVSIWRTYFVANEWNEIQTMRKINHIFQIFAVVFFLKVVGFENVATKDPDGSVLKDSSSYQAEHSQMFRYGVGALTYLLVAIVQWIFFTFIYERFVEDKIRQFTDLCSMSNISVFVMAHAQFGYYIHGRSVHGKADTNMTEMCNMMKREEEDLCGQRGLLPNTEQQTFTMSLPRKLRLKYEQVMLPVALEGAGAVGADAGKNKSAVTDKQVEAYGTINKFLSAFIDHSLKDLDYVVKDKTLLESVLETEFFDASEKGIFYNDDGHSFDECLFYGNEGILIIFDTLLFCIIDLICMDFVLSGIITYLIIELIAMGRDSGGRKNLAKKTLVDERFLI